jgi:hypothetical protein
MRTLLSLSAILLLSALAVETASAARLTNAQIRRLGFAGVYDGEVQGNYQVRDKDNKMVQRLVSERAREILPVRQRSVVTGPSGRNGFFLVLRSVSGNARRITVRQFYSGKSYNPVQRLEMVGNGTRTLKVVKFGRANPQYEMSLRDRFNERSVEGGHYYGTWDVSGRLFK